MINLSPHVMKEIQSIEDIKYLEDSHSVGQYVMRDIAIVRGSGAVLYDARGKEYLDFGASIGTCIVGHSNPSIVNAILWQIQRLTHIYGMFYNDVRAELIKELVRITPQELTRVFLCNSGSETVEAAIKFARALQEKSEIIVMKGSFHGKTFGALSATWKKTYRNPFEPLVPGFKFVPFGDITAVNETITNQTAAVLVEPIQGENGVKIPPQGYLKELRDLCTEKNILLILDEVQTGFGRTGKMFAHEWEGIAPDILCLSKSMANGLPMGAVVTTEDITILDKGIHTNTFGGNPVSCVASLATIQYLEEHDLIQRARRLGQYFMQRLADLQQEHQIIKQLRGKGLMVAIDLQVKAKPYILALANKGILAIGSGRKTIRFLPPLVVSREQINTCIDVLEEVFTSG